MADVYRDVDLFERGAVQLGLDWRGEQCSLAKSLINHVKTKIIPIDSSVQQWHSHDNIYGRACDHKIEGMLHQNIYF